ncbi:PilC/PilY family type IV pilus protein [Gammaproteobacteria bacterium AB-CW1]|uniref:PilC/PilY family type IV pilus protein n=1 Tax=Natronospira elongata TaxID=3110268 RepID=A0AAP6JDU1_9GAMM|nr:PilC/PilY family type IV pilus protein [Gammaproteobacteria bacterium AB-CW1]
MKKNPSRMMKRLTAVISAVLFSLLTVPLVTADIARVPLFVTEGGLPPNILFIPDTSESMQEGLSAGRVALDWDNCNPGEDLDPDECPAGARYENSKASIVKRVTQSVVDDYGRTGQIRMGLLSYQQYPPSTDRDDVFDDNNPRTVQWRLTHRPADLRYAEEKCPSFYRPYEPDPDCPLATAWDSDLPWYSENKRFREEHPTLDDVWVFYNVAVPGYYRNTGDTHPPTTDRNTFAHEERDHETHSYRIYQDMSKSNPGQGNAEQDDDSGLWFFNREGAWWWITLTDSMRQRGVDSWGDRVGFFSLNQPEWRANASPGLGYLHVPIGGRDEDGNVDDDHWALIENKLKPQRHDWGPGDGNIMIDETWPLISSGLTPLEGTILTARDYFLGENDYFGSDQGRQGNMSVPESCDANAAIWVTDGLPSVDKDGDALGEDPVEAMRSAREALEKFSVDTGVRTFIVGFAMPPGVAELFEDEDDFETDNPLDFLAEAGGTGTAFDAQDEDDLDEIMDAIFEQIVRDARSSAASIATNSTRLDTDTLAFLASFDTTDWAGELRAYRITDEATLGDLHWDAEEMLPGPFQRHIITWDPESENTRRFRWDVADGLTDDQKELLNVNPDTGDVDGLGMERLWWLRGDQSDEGAGEGELRQRERLLGDIVNSDPLFVHAQDFGYRNDEDFDGGGSYSQHVHDMRENRPMLYVAANDGKLHGFDAETGEEVFSYVPDAIMHKLNRLTSQDYQREYFFDGSPRVNDVWDGSNWRRILVGSFGAGERGVYALDISNPEDPEVLWERVGGPTTGPNAVDHAHEDIGYVLGQPSVGKTASGDWVVMVPSGYQSENDRAALVFLDPLNGEEVDDPFLPDDDDNPAGNGMATPIPVDIEGDRLIDRIYMGDLQGQLWRVDVSGNNWRAPGGLRSGNTPVPLFTAEGPNGEVQPITVRPQVARSPDGDVFVFFGTGKYFENDDNLVVSNPDVQSFYGIRDQESEIERDDLLQQEIIDELEDFDFELRVTTDHELTTEDGWYLDLISPLSHRGREGERVIFNPIFRNGRIIFPTMIPSEDPCAAGGDGWLMEMEAFSGSRLDFSPFDLAGDGEFGEESYVETTIDGETVKVPVSGIRSRVGIPTTPAIISSGPGIEGKMMMGSEAEMEELPMEKGDDSLGRQSWRQNR